LNAGSKRAHKTRPKAANDEIHLPPASGRRIIVD
jgi:hypothetical protein